MFTNDMQILWKGFLDRNSFHIFFVMNEVISLLGIFKVAHKLNLKYMLTNIA